MPDRITIALAEATPALVLVVSMVDAAGDPIDPSTAYDSYEATVGPSPSSSAATASATGVATSSSVTFTFTSDDTAAVVRAAKSGGLLTIACDAADGTLGPRVVYDLRGTWGHAEAGATTQQVEITWTVVAGSVTSTVYTGPAGAAGDGGGASAWGAITGTLADQADLAGALDAKVGTTGDETVAGVKTFASSPIVPAPTADNQAATKKYVDDNAGGGSGVTAREVAALDLSRVVAWDVGTGSGAVGAAASGQAWEAAVGSWSRDADGVAHDGTTNAALVLPVGLAVEVAATVRRSGSSTLHAQGLFPLWVDANNWVRVIVVSGTLRLDKRVGGVETTVASTTVAEADALGAVLRLAALANDAGTALRVAGTLHGARVTGSLSGADYTALSASTKAGLFSSTAGTSARFTDIVVRETA